ncbi:MAG: methylenetetrahydrofolate reductase [NAD(P)H] [Rickettsiales bacterium]|jgi:methylenetetrahydrofolate reductase (NADPH)|nr:methylenetetrahydrofolate reductase [NAD(P)H] [Rickettsiales bacterium]
MLDSKDIQISFEFFPPKTEAMEALLWESVESLQFLKPRFVSVTYGAGGGTRDRTHKIISKIIEETALVPASHLTCIGSSKAEIKDIAEDYWDKGVKHIVALRGDLPDGYIHPADGYDYAWQLVEALKSFKDFEISVAGYPEKHPEAKTLIDDLDNLKRKIDSGATRVITQFFFDNNKYYEFLNHIERMNLKAEIVPGILPIMNFNQVIKFAEGCNSHVPKKYYDLFAQAKTDNDKKALAEKLVIDQCLDLKANNINNFHFYTLNRSETILAICKALNI